MREDSDVAAAPLMEPMLKKVGFVLGGYLALLLAAWAVGTGYLVLALPENISVRDAVNSDFRRYMLWLAIFGMVAISATAGALYFLRPHERFWRVMSSTAPGVAAASVAAFVNLFVGAVLQMGSLLLVWVSLRWILLTPFLAIALFTSGVFAPTRRARIVLVASGLVEVAVVVAVFAVAVFGFGVPPLR